MTHMPRLPQDGMSGSDMRRRRAQQGEDKFISEIVASRNGMDMYFALMRIEDLSTGGRDRLLEALAQSGNLEAIGLAYAHFKGMPEPARNVLIDAVIASGDPTAAFVIVADKKRLSTKRRGELVKIVAKNAFDAGCAKDFSPHLTREERSYLGDAIGQMAA